MLNKVSVVAKILGFGISITVGIIELCNAIKKIKTNRTLTDCDVAAIAKELDSLQQERGLKQITEI